MEVDALRHSIPATGSTELITPMWSTTTQVAGGFRTEEKPI